MKRLRLLAAALLLFLLVPTSAFADRALVLMDKYPPWKIVDDQGIGGIDVLLVTALLKEVGVTPRFEAYPWKRNLSMMENGEADIITGILKRPERELYMHFIEPPYKTRSSKVFYIRKGTRDITGYADLHGKAIGVKRAVKYFPQFDNDDTLDKHVVNDARQNFKKLSVNRLDVVISTESIADYLLAELKLSDRIVKASLRHDKNVPVHFAVSRKSPLMARIDDLEAAARRLRDQGRFDTIIRDYFKALAEQP